MSSFKAKEEDYKLMEYEIKNKYLKNSHLGISKQGHTNSNSFNRFKNFEDQDFLTTGIAYVFFTRPQLHFGDQLPSYTKDIDMYKHLVDNKEQFFRTCPFIDEIVNRKSKMYSEILDDLKGGRGFMHLLTNLAQNFETHDVTTETTTTSETFKGYKLTLPTSNIESQVGGTFNINYNETRNMEITVLHKIWSDYIQGVRSGNLLPSQTAIRGFGRRNVKNRGYIDYMNSVYYFLLDADGKTIKYYAKYTGVFPTNVPFNAMNWELGSNPLRKVSISYAYNFKEDMNPEILKEFNYVSGQIGTPKLIDISKADLNSYTFKTTVENSWKKNVMVKTSYNNGEVHDYLLFEDNFKN